MSGCCQTYPDITARKALADLLIAMQQNQAKDFEQDGKLDALFNMYRGEVRNAVSEYLEIMKDSGELDALLSNLEQLTKPYYTGITTTKKRDTASGTDYYVSIVPAKDENGYPLRWQLGIANDAYDAVGLESTIAFAHRKNATIAVNAGVYDIETGAPIGSLIQNGRIVTTAYPTDAKYQYLAIMLDGSLRVYSKDTSPGTMLNDGATDAVCIFGTLVRSGEAVLQTDTRQDPRQSIGVRADGATVIVTCDGRNPGTDEGMSYDDLARIHLNEGSVNAWILDGGGSASTVLRGVKQNDNIDHFITDRAVNNFLYIQKPVNVDPDNVAWNDLGNVKQLLSEMHMKQTDFTSGYIRLRCPENYFAPGMEFNLYGEDTRRGKLGMTLAGSETEKYFYVSFRPGDQELSNLFRLYSRGAYIQTYHGDSSTRPNGPVGLQYFDETLGKPIWRKSSTEWVDASGAVV